jgi:hypothetical protein
MLLGSDRGAMPSYRRMLSVTSLVLGILPALSGSGMAAAQDYRFELAGPIVKSGNTSVVKIRLIHISDGKPIPAAIVINSKFDMGPEGMETMTAPVKVVPSFDPAVHQFEVQPSMPGKWAIEIAAKVQGETETVHGTVTVPVPK